MTLKEFYDANDDNENETDYNRIYVRYNTRGDEYHIIEFKDTTGVWFKGNGIVVDLKIENFLALWFRWTMKREFIQDVFRMLTPNQREFLITGMTEEEWNVIFPSEQENN